MTERKLSSILLGFKSTEMGKESLKLNRVLTLIQERTTAISDSMELQIDLYLLWSGVMKRSEFEENFLVNIESEEEVVFESNEDIFIDSAISDSMELIIDLYLFLSGIDHYLFLSGVKKNNTNAFKMRPEYIKYIIEKKSDSGESCERSYYMAGVSILELRTKSLPVGKRNWEALGKIHLDTEVGFVIATKCEENDDLGGSILELWTKTPLPDRQIPMRGSRRKRFNNHIDLHIELRSRHDREKIFSDTISVSHETETVSSEIKFSEYGVTGFNKEMEVIHPFMMVNANMSESIYVSIRKMPKGTKEQQRNTVTKTGRCVPWKQGRHRVKGLKAVMKFPTLIETNVRVSSERTHDVLSKFITTCAF